MHHPKHERLSTWALLLFLLAYLGGIAALILYS